MSYTVKLTDGTIFATVEDNTLDTSSSQTLVGKNYVGYAEFIGEDLIHLLENSAGTSSPSRPLTGQLWFDKLSGILHVFNGSKFKGLSAITTGNNEPLNPVLGDFWFKTQTQQLFIFGGNAFILIGPLVSDASSTGAVADIITDTFDIDHSVIRLIVDSNTVAIVSLDNVFTPAGVGVDGFDLIGPGIQMSTDNPDNLFEGTARRALNLVDAIGDDHTYEDIMQDVDTEVNNKVSKSGDVMTGQLTLPFNPTLNLHAATKQYVDSNSGTGGEGKVDRSGDTMTGQLTLPGNPSLNLHATTKEYVDGATNSKVNTTGDIMTGRLTLSGDPTSDFHAATKQYVDNRPDDAANKVSKTGDTMTGRLTLSGDPISNLHAATKQYVDTAGGQIGFPAGTRMTFFQSSAPTGWTTYTSINNAMMRIVSSGGGGSGGTDSPILNNKVSTHSHGASSNTYTSNHTHTFSDTSSIQSVNHTHASGTLATNTVAGHVHEYKVPWSNDLNWQLGYAVNGNAGARIVPEEARNSTINGAHSHSFTGSTGTVSANHTHYVTGTTTEATQSHSHTISVSDNSGSNWSPMYVNMIIGTKQ